MSLNKFSRRGIYPSAIWEVNDYPGLIIYRQDVGSKWQIGFMGLTDDATSFSRKLYNTPGLRKGYFHTRKEALQAVEVAVLFASSAITTHS